MKIIILGIIEIILGLTSLVVGVVARVILKQSNWSRDIAPSTWIGCWFLLLGVFCFLLATSNFRNYQLAGNIIAGVLTAFAVLFYAFAIG